MTLKSSNFLPFVISKGDAYGFTVRPQHLQRFKEHVNIYKEEEEERSKKWKRFLDQQAQSVEPCSAEGRSNNRLHGEFTEQNAEPGPKLSREGDESGGGSSIRDIQTERDHEEEVQLPIQTNTHKVQTWAQIRTSLRPIENYMSFRVKKRENMKEEQMITAQNHLPRIEEGGTLRGESEEDSKEELYDNEIVDGNRNGPAEETAAGDGISPEPFFPWKEELEFLVHGGVPKDLRGEVWQAFVGVRARRVDSYYQNLLAQESDVSDTHKHGKLGDDSKGHNQNRVGVPEKWRKQIEKVIDASALDFIIQSLFKFDLPRTFPGHPALNENGRSSLRRLLLAYARHNPSVGYCQAMNFFGGILLLMMPEENAFWTLVGILDDYFDGYFSEEMIESQVDQLVFEELMRERFPKLINHLDYLGVQVEWISTPWFLSIFVNMLPWESVLRIWDVLLFEGNRVMLYRTALALMELYGPALVTTQDAGDAITLIQSLAGSTFDSSQLVLTACIGFLAVTEDRLQELREKHRPTVLEALQERSKGKVSKGSKGLATKLYSFKHNSPIKNTNAKAELGEELKYGDISHLELGSANLDDFLSGLASDSEVDSLPDLQEQVVWLKVELCRMLEEKRSSVLRAEELETALMEMVKQDNRRQLSARVEQLEQEVAELQQVLSDKKEQEHAMLQVLMRVEQEQKSTEDARIRAEQDAVAQRYAMHMLQGKYENAMASLAQMEKRVVMAESLLEATIQYEQGQVKAQSSPRSVSSDSPRETPTRKMGLLSFGLGWRDRNKGKPTTVEEPSHSKHSREAYSPSSSRSTESNGKQEK